MGVEVGDFGGLLRSAGVDPRDVRVLRHVIDKDSAFDVWKNDRRRFEAYQSLQLKTSSGSFKQRIWAACIGLRDGRTVFVGLYRANEPKPVPEGYEETLGRYPPSSDTHLWYDCQPMPELSEYSGRLLLEWTGRNWTQRGVTARQIELLSEVIRHDPLPVATGRNPPWTRDELILALDLYMKHRGALPDNSSAVIRELSDTLNKLGIRMRPSGSPTFRNKNGVYMKLANFRRFDPQFTSQGKKGLSRGNKDEEVVWNEFAGDRQKLQRVAEAIRKEVDSPTFETTAYDDLDEASEASEGRVLTRVHRTRERNRKLVETKKAKVFRASGKLVCEACDFDFEEMYGSRGRMFIEAHHTKPVEELGEEGKTHIDDLALLCSNCHRMIHVSRPWLSVEELRSILAR